MTTQDLIDLKKRVEKSKSELSELIGKKDVLMDDLKSKFGCSSIKEAKKKVQNDEKEIDALEEEKVELISELEENFEF